jgi:hypothetical protein
MADQAREPVCVQGEDCSGDPFPVSWPGSSGNPGMCRALVRAHHKLHGTLDAANPRFIQREVFENASIKPSAEYRPHRLDSAETGQQ